MSETNPQKRIVSKGRYVRVMGKKVSLYSYGCVVLTLGIIGILWIVLFALFSIFGRWDEGPPPSDAEKVITLLIAGSVTIGFFWHSQSVFVKAKAIETVEPLTDRNARLLPPEESLVRAAELPPTEQPAELLRAVQTGQETPKEQLLRSVAGDEFR